MRLPESLLELAPAGAIVRALEAGEALVRAAAREANARVLVSTADGEGLARFERDYGLSERPELEPSARRARVRAARWGAQTLTPARLGALAETLAGAREGVVEEDFPRRAVTLTAVLPALPGASGSLDALRETAERLFPAHLELTVLPGAAGALDAAHALHGGSARSFTGEAIAL